MASIFGHIAASSALGYSFFPKQTRTATLVVAGFCAFAPDLDVLAFRFGIPYESQWGHRGWTHSLVFAVVFGLAMAFLFRLFAKTPENRRLGLWLVLSTLSHPLLDMLTNGGRGCAFWWPFSTERLFLPFRPVLVSPMGVSGFFSEWGLRVLLSETIWIGVPAMAMCLIAWWRRKELA